MRTTWLLFSLCIVVGGLVLHDGHAGPRTLNFTISTPGDRIALATGPDGTTITGRDENGAALPALGDTGRPALPMRVVNVLVPRGERVGRVYARSTRSTTLARDVSVALAPPPSAPPDAPAPAVLPAPAAPLAPDAGGPAFPSELVRYAGTGSWNGYQIASVMVFPVRVEGGDVVVHTDIELTVELEADAAPAIAKRAGRMTVEAQRGVESTLRTLVLNPSDESSYPPIAPEPLAGAFNPSSVPSLEGSPVEYVIVTTPALAPSFEPFADWKTAKGVPTVVRTVDWITANYRRGADTAETIRFFLQDAYANWGTRYVLIAGDTQDVPVRYFYSTYYYGGTLIPTDMYYAALDGDFNADHDALFGEQPADAPDLWPELNVGRLPVSTQQVADSLITKIMRYETAPAADYTDKVMFLAEVLLPSPWAPGQTIQLNGADIANYVYASKVMDPSRRIARLYETPSSYSGSVQESRQAAIDSMEAGYNHVFHIGHGYRFNMHCADDNIAVPDADAMANPHRPFNLFMLNCTAAAFDFDCLAEHLLRNPSGGAVSVIGASNSTFAEVTSYYMASYAGNVFQNDIVHIGEAFTLSRMPRTPQAEIGDNIDLWTHYIYCALADPEMPLVTGTIRHATVMLPDSVIAGSNTIPVSVSVNAVPEDSATVCLFKEGEDYRIMATDVNGAASFTFNTPTPGFIRVVVSGRNLARYESTIKVAAATGPLLAVDGVSVDDDSVGGTDGNGDGIVDAGETVDLLPTIHNTGGTASAAATAYLLGAPAHVTIQTSSTPVASLAPGQAAPAGSPWRIHVDTSAPDEFVAGFNVGIVSGPLLWTGSLAKVVHAPKLEVTGVRKSDEAPYGNGDGIITNGESFLLWVSIKNYGTGQADGLTALLGSLSGGATVTQSASSYSALGALVEGENTVPFVLNEADVSLNNPLELTAIDSRGRVLTHDMELREPVTPEIQAVDASLGVDRLLVSWDASPSPDVAGYRVYRSTSSSGPFGLASPDVVHHTLFTDDGLAPNTRYYYTITAVDTSGNQGPQSPVTGASTNPPQLTGWPNVVADVSANSPAVGDIDSDGRKEVVIGNDVMYAWHPDGSEVIDGDGQPLTWGILSVQGSGFIGPAALAKLDSNFGLDIVAAAYTSREVYCFNGQGNPLPGWPRPTIDYVRASVAVGDLDGDGNLEIVAVDQNAYLYAWHTDGTEVIDGDLNPATDGVFKRLPPTSQWQYQAPALADIDGDNKDEIIIPTQDMKLYVFNGDGSDVPGWPRTLPSYAGGGVAVGDIDNNGDLEIVVTVRGTGEMYALHHDNTLLWTRWINTNLFFNPSPALADLTGDGKLEVVVPSSNGKIYAVQYNGSDAPGWPVTYSTKTYTESSPVIADVTGDGVVDVLLGDEGKFINGWSATGVPLDGFPLVIKDSVRGTPSITDLDGDGDVDIVLIGYDRTVYVWDLSAPWNPAHAPWPMFHANLHRNCQHGFVVATAVGGGGTRPAPAFALDQNHPNPYNPTTTIGFELSAGASRPVSLVVYDVTGARIRTLIDRSMTAGRHSVEWDGRNDAGSAVASGVYFYRLAEPGHVFTRKMVLLK